MKTALATPTVPAAAAPIYCLGDSHVSFFAGADVIQPAWPAPAATRLPWFRVLHLGPILAFSLARPNTRERGRERLFAALERTVPPRARVLLCFGEIDCRAHFLKQAARQGRPVEAIVTDCRAAYFHVVQDVQQRGFEVIVYNAIATRLRTPRRPRREDDYVAVGSWSQRNAATRLFNQGARQRCQACGAKFLENYPGLVTSRDKTIPWFYFDAIHLSQRAMPMTLRALAELYPEAGYPRPPLPHPGWLARLADRARKRLRRWCRLT